VTGLVRSAALLLIAVVAACGPAVGNPGQPSFVVETPRGLVPDAMRGTWTADIENTTASSGVWTLVVNGSDLTLQNPIGGNPFSIDPTAVTTTTLSVAASADCPDQSVVTPGTYSISLQGDTLRFTLTSDSCGDRSAVLTGGTWTRKP
jgi:hypothetical protein